MKHLKAKKKDYLEWINFYNRIQASLKKNVINQNLNDVKLDK